MGKPGFPPSPRAYVHVRRGAPREPPGGRRRGRRRRGGETPPLRRPASRQGGRPPNPPAGRGCGENRFPHPPAGRGRGETRLPHTPRRGRMFTLGGVRPGNLRVADAGAGGVGAGKPRPYAGPPPGRGGAPQTLPRAGGSGNPVSPYPCGAGVWGNPVAPHPRSKGPGVAEYLLKDHAPPGQHGIRDDMSPDICIGG